MECYPTRKKTLILAVTMQREVEPGLRTEWRLSNPKDFLAEAFTPRGTGHGREQNRAA